MKFDRPAGSNPSDRMKVLGRPQARIDGPLKTTGTATYSYEHQEVGGAPAYGVIVGAAIARGRIRSINAGVARAAPGVIAVVTHENSGPVGVGAFYVGRPLAGPRIDHYHQAVAIVVADTFEQARAAGNLLVIDYAREPGSFDIKAIKDGSPTAKKGEFGPPPFAELGDFAGAFAAAPVRLDETYTTPDQTHAMMEPHATIARWAGDQLTCWCPIQQLNWGRRDLATILGIDQARIRLVTPFIGGSFGGKGTVLADTVAAALGARAAGRPVKVALTRTIMANNTTHRPATIQRIRLGAARDGRLTAIGHECWNGNLRGGRTENATASTRLLYAGANRMTHQRLGVLDLAEGNAMRAPGEATGMMALEIAMDELAEKLGLDPVELRIRNDVRVDPNDPKKPFSTRKLVECLRTGADRFGWSARAATPGAVRDGGWLVGMGVAAAIRGAPIAKSAARVRLDRIGTVTVETDMTDVGTGSYTIVGQTAA